MITRQCRKKYINKGEKTPSLAKSGMYKLVGATVAYFTVIRLGMTFLVVDPHDNLAVWALRCFGGGPAIVLGVLGGFVGSTLAYKRFRQISPWALAAVGGLIAGLLAALGIYIMMISTSA